LLSQGTAPARSRVSVVLTVVAQDRYALKLGFNMPSHFLEPFVVACTGKLRAKRGGQGGETNETSGLAKLDVDGAVCVSSSGCRHVVSRPCWVNV
jgi:hypothetical protein